jgi:hypothetical protein
MTAALASAWRLHIAEGPNAGAELVLSPGLHRVGRDAGNDIVLADAAIALQHISIEIDGRGASLVTHAEGSALQGRALAAGRTTRMAPGADLRVGTTLLRVSGPACAKAGMPSKSVGVAVAACGALVAAFTYFSGASAPPPRNAPAQLAASLDDVPAAQRALESHLQNLGLGNNVRVAAADGALVATGALTPEQTAGWHNAQAWFDGRFGGRIGLVAQIGAVGVQTPMLDIAAVSLRPVPNVITRGGERYTTGAVLPGGWTITAISVDAVMLRRGDQDVRMAL